MESLQPDPHALRELVQYRMPFGKYKDRRLVDLPESYVIWFKQKGFPKGKLGDLLQCVYEIKLNGLEPLLEPLKSPSGKTRLEKLPEGSY
jgi:uncharacterized protein